jgi:hypothetical protein
MPDFENRADIADPTEMNNMLHKEEYLDVHRSVKRDVILRRDDIIPVRAWALVCSLGIF